jgi:hypothetical protein
MDSFEIKSTDGDGALIFWGEIPRGLTGYEGCDFNVSLVSNPLSATLRVYDIQPQTWSEFFADIAQNWRGWEGKKEKESLEHHLRVVATSDSLGHISLRVYLRDVFSGSDWRAEDVISMEAGQLEAVAAQAKRYFG